MTIRPTQRSNFDQVAAGIRRNLISLVRAQEQIATGKRILRPSDDGIGTAISMSLSRQKAGVEAHLTSVESVQPVLATSTLQLEEASSLLTESRALALQALNGTQSPSDRRSIADQIDQIASNLLEIANAQFGDHYLFGGTETGHPPYSELDGSGSQFVDYEGDSLQKRIRIGKGTFVDINLPGNQVFSGDQYRSTDYAGITGIANGTDSNSGSGYTSLELRTDSVAGAAVGGLALAVGGDNTILGDHVLEVDAANRTVKLGNGNVVGIPTPAPASLEVTDEDGSSVFIDFSGWGGAFVTTTLTGEGSISLNGEPFVALDRTDTNFQMQDPKTGNLVHLDGTGVTRAGTEPVAFNGAVNLFDTLRGIAADLRSEDSDLEDDRKRVSLRFDELVEGQERLLTGLGKLGSRHERLNTTEVRLRDLSTELEGLRSNVVDVDIATAALELQEAELSLQLTQSTGARLMQQSLLNYLG
ncbi:MAG: flagellar hook-associated protein FlgL [Planctomycetota bacterium]|nr:flagellar hook-associated protein FlgL [Planctomycetota bacterium]